MTETMDEVWPKYRLIAPFYAPNDLYIPEGEDIEFKGVPNAQMAPLNDAAVRRMEEYLKGLPGGATPRVEDIMEHAMRERPVRGVPTAPPGSGEIRMPTYDGNVPPMPGTSIVGFKDRTVPREEARVVTGSDGPAKGTKKVMGTVIAETPVG